MHVIWQAVKFNSLFNGISKNFESLTHLTHTNSRNFALPYTLFHQAQKKKKDGIFLKWILVHNE